MASVYFHHSHAEGLQVIAGVRFCILVIVPLLVIVLPYRRASQDRSADVGPIHHLHVHGVYAPAPIRTMTGGTAKLCNHAGAAESRATASW
ncbi:MAG: hypothetical protein ACE5I2_12830 [Anaerolineae bacterium]